MPLASSPSRSVSLLDLQAHHQDVGPAFREAIDRVIESGAYINGPEVAECEADVAAYCQAQYGIGVSSGTDALLIALMAEEIGPGDEVITTPFTFFATAGCISRVGAKPVFVDIDPATCNIDAKQVAAAITPRTRAIIPVHLYGQMAETAQLKALADEHDLVLIEDCAQAIGAEEDGHRAGSIGHYGAFSFFPAKNLGALGDGGIVTTNDKERANRLRRLRVHGAEPKYFHAVIGGNFRLDTIHAAVVKAKLPCLDQWTESRQRNAQRYDSALQEVGLISGGHLMPLAKRQSRHVYNQYIIRTNRRDALQAFLKDRGVSTAVYYPLSLHQQECFAYLGHKEGEFPEAELAAQEVLALPVHPHLSADDQDYVIEQLVAFFR
ncbi:MAG: DegT/DnrJ/EryC1/StrS family aminotransferase [Verrucomicrobiota bacterium JB022]|nr:DegT/DnrJ/EryC1/StrS family aminotransferase [Verrucomicrobiota bacterium JB022]